MGVWCRFLLSEYTDRYLLSLLLWFGVLSMWLESAVEKMKEGKGLFLATFADGNGREPRRRAVNTFVLFIEEEREVRRAEKTHC